MELKFIGPLGKVTGSCAWMRDISRGWGFLVDCGIQQGESTAQEWNSCLNWPFDPASIKFVVLTHAHMDHCGLLPMLYKRGFTGAVYCTQPTREIAKILLQDAAKRDDALYAAADITRIQWKVENRLGAYRPLGDDLFLQFYRSGHIVGATSVAISWGQPKSNTQKRIVFSGDVGPGRKNTEILPFLRYPMHSKPGDFAVIESTYGGKVRESDHKCPTRRLQNLKNLLEQTKHSGGTLAILAFGTGRTQDILFDLHKIDATHPGYFDTVDFYLDSPLGKAINTVTLDALVGDASQQLTPKKIRPSWLGKQLFRDLDLDSKDPDHIARMYDICLLTLSSEKIHTPSSPLGNQIAQHWRQLIQPVTSRKNLMAQNGGSPRVLVISSGMGDGGPAAEWLPALLGCPKNHIALSGFCASGSVGAQLQQLIKFPSEERRLHPGAIAWRSNNTEKREFYLKDIQAGLHCLSGYSAHADQPDLVDWLFENHPEHGKQAAAKTVFIQHGKDKDRVSLESAVRKRACDWDLPMEVVLPDESSGWFDLDIGAEKLNNDTVCQRLLAERHKIDAQLAELRNRTE